ncbi:MAG: endonuclease III [Patescibacteria group bacterium]
MPKTQEIRSLLKHLDEAYPNTEPQLRHRNAFELLISIILSAQCTDARVNIVTQSLFPKDEPATPEYILKLGEDEVRHIIYPTGYFNSKTKAVMGTAAALLGKEIPSDIESLTKLPGVGRKTAQVLQSQWFHIPALPVDTHVHRVANRLGLAKSGGNRDKTERQLKAVIPQSEWSKFHLQLIYHGRAICTAYKPKCLSCPVYTNCKWPNKMKQKTHN